MFYLTQKLYYKSFNLGNPVFIHIWPNFYAVHCGDVSRHLCYLLNLKNKQIIYPPHISPLRRLPEVERHWLLEFLSSTP